MQWLYILLCAFHGNYYVYLCVFILIRKFLYVVNVFIPMMVFKYLKRGYKQKIVLYILRFVRMLCIVKKWDFHLVLMYMHLLLWYLFGVKKWSFYLVLMGVHLLLWCFFMVKKWDFYLVLMYGYLLLWCFFMVKNY